MLRQAFHYLRGFTRTGIMHPAVSPVFLSRCGNALLATVLLMPAAVSSPLIMVQSKPFDFPAQIFAERSAEAAGPLSSPWVLSEVSLSPLALESLWDSSDAAFFHSMAVGDLGMMLTAEAGSGLAGANGETRLERYPYLLLTLSLILLAFRPAQSALRGRH